MHFSHVFLFLFVLAVCNVSISGQDIFFKKEIVTYLVAYHDPCSFFLIIQNLGNVIMSLLTFCIPFYNASYFTYYCKSN
uniref:Uncharacterized protein n=1 Tax=Arundo donax TaxID=35708 RepID=A0A0A8XQN6_ARUDO